MLQLGLFLEFQGFFQVFAYFPLFSQLQLPGLSDGLLLLDELDDLDAVGVDLVHLDQEHLLEHFQLVFLGLQVLLVLLDGLPVELVGLFLALQERQLVRQVDVVCFQGHLV